MRLDKQLHRPVATWLLLAIALFGLTSLGAAQSSVGESEQPPRQGLLVDDQKSVDAEWVTEHLGGQVPLEVEFVDEDGVSLALADIVDRPTIILPIYFYCPSSCSRNLANLAVALNRLSHEAGRDYRVIALSFSHTETAENARRAKNNYLKLLYDGFPAESWKFLTGQEQAIKQVTDAIGYRFARLDNETFVHPTALVVVDDDGRIMRYVYGSFIPGDIDIALAGAEQSTPLLSVKRFLEFCFDGDAAGSRKIFNLVKVTVLSLFAVGLGVLCIVIGRRARKRPPSSPPEGSSAQDTGK